MIFFPSLLPVCQTLVTWILDLPKTWGDCRNALVWCSFHERSNGIINLCWLHLGAVWIPVLLSKGNSHWRSSAQQVSSAASSCPTQLPILLENHFVLQVFNGRLYHRMILPLVTFRECCLKNILTSITEWQGADVTNLPSSLEWTGRIGSRFWLNDFPSHFLCISPSWTIPDGRHVMNS